MARITPTLDPTVPADTTSKVVTTAGLIAALYFGAEILVPVALAILLSFAMAPAVKLLRKLGLGRGFPVFVTVIVTFVLLTGLAALIASQVRDLSADLPSYERTVLAKVESLKSMSNAGGVQKLENAVRQFSRILGRAPGEEAPATRNQQGEAPGPHAPAAQGDKAPMLVQVVQPALGPLEAVLLVSMPLLHPLSVMFIVMVFVVFILLHREDLRNRAIRLFGASDLQRATAAIDDGGIRLSRYLLTQCAVNTGAGMVVGASLWAIGVPSPILLGILFAFARFVPYIGPVIGAVLPLGLAIAVDPGWSMVLWTLAALSVIELVIGQVIEPVVYGHNTGLSPVAIVLAATFWTVLWGPVGLFLSTPLTVCLVVLGRHVESLAVLDVLLGDRPALTLAETFYQRMLANDPVEAADQAQTCLEDMSVGHYYDDVALPALLMAQDDATDGRLDEARQERIKVAALEVVDDLEQAATESADGGEPPSRHSFFGFGRGKAAEEKGVVVDDLVPEQVPDRLKPPGSVLCIGARGPLDDAAAAMLAQVYNSHGIGAVAEGFVRLSKTGLPTLDVAHVALIVVSTLDGSSPAFLRFILRRLRRHAPHATILIGAWWRREGYRDTDEEIDEAIRQPKVATFLDAVRFCFADTTAEPSRSRPTPSAAP